MSGQYIAGVYTATYNAKELGQTESPGIRLSHRFHKRMIQSDAGGDAPVDALYRGRDQFAQFTLLEAGKPGVLDLLEPYTLQESNTPIPFNSGPIGQFDVGSTECPGRAKPLVLTVKPGTCAAAFGPATITFPRAIIAEDFPIDVLFGNDLRMIPMRLRIYPDDNGVFGTQT